MAALWECSPPVDPSSEGGDASGSKDLRLARSAGLAVGLSSAQPV